MKRKFKPISYLLIGVILGSLIPISSIFASTPIKLIINNQEISCDSPPQLINGRVMVPARNVAENLGGVVSWDSTRNAVIITSNAQSTTQLQNQSQIPGQQTIVENNQGKIYKRDGLQFVIVDNIEYVSLRDISELSYDKGYSYGYDTNSKTATFQYNPYPAHPTDKTISLLENIPVKVIQDKSYLNYDFYLIQILPLIK